MQALNFRCIVIGGGAAGFFGAIRLAELCPEASVVILERSLRVLDKVRISGGGRCNLTHACFNPRELINNYPRGGKALLGPFTRFGPADTVDWFESHGVELKTEADGRMFPQCDDSAAIVNALLRSAKENKVDIRTGCGVKSLVNNEDCWKITLDSDEVISAEYILLAAGSSPQVWRFLGELGIQMVEQVPSLFTFHIRDKALQERSGVSVEDVELELEDAGIRSRGPLLFTHWGLSGPAVLKCSAFGARFLAENKYQAQLRINYLPELRPEQIRKDLMNVRTSEAKKSVVNVVPYVQIPRRVWSYLTGRCRIPEPMRWADCSNAVLDSLVSELHSGVYAINGKSTFKEEFVTCGGVSLNEIDTRTFEARRFPGLYFAGEVLDVDAVTGGFNFQHAWTSAWLAAESIANANR